VAKGKSHLLIELAGGTEYGIDGNISFKNNIQAIEIRGKKTKRLVRVKVFLNHSAFWD
jgi:hypothetical protein